MRKLMLACASATLIGAAACDGTTPPPTGTPVDLSFAPCVGGDAAPSWFAFQDGDGGWSQVTQSANGSFNFTISSGRGGISYYDASAGLLIIYATTDELKANMPACNGGIARTISGQVTGYATADDISLVAGNSNTSVFGSASPAPATYSIFPVEPSVSDLIGVRYRLTGGTPGVAFQATPSRVFFRRNVTGTSTAIVDLASATESGAPQQQTLTVTNLSAGEELSSLSYLALPTTMANIAEYDAPAALVTGTATVPFYGVPAARLGAGDSHMLQANALFRSNSSALETVRFMSVVFAAPADQSLTLGPLLGNVTVAGSSRPSATYTVQPEYGNLFDVVFSQGNSATFRQVEVLATRAYLGTGTTVTLAVPNMSGTPGFSSSWLMNTGVNTTWTFLATDAGLSVLNRGPITHKGAERSNTFTP